MEIRIRGVLDYKVINSPMVSCYLITFIVNTINIQKNIILVNPNPFLFENCLPVGKWIFFSEIFLLSFPEIKFNLTPSTFSYHNLLRLEGEPL